MVQWLRIWLPRRHRLDPWSWKIPYAVEQLSQQAAATKPMSLEPVLRNERNHHHEKPAHHN